MFGKGLRGTAQAAVRRHWRIPAAAGAVALLAAGCGSSASKASGPITPNYQYAVSVLSTYGYQPPPGSMPEMGCTDQSYRHAVQDGLTFGTYNLQPYFYTGPNGQPEGFEYDLLHATLAYAGITKLHIVYAPFDTLIPALTANRIDMMPAHETPERRKVIGFTAPVYWYGPALLVAAGNPGHVTSYADLSKANVSVGVVTGSASSLYLQRVGKNAITYTDQTTEFASLTAGREDAVLDDAPDVASYLQAHPNPGFEVLHPPALPPATLQSLGYSDFEWGIRKGDCSLDMAISRSLAVLRAQGVVKTILERADMAGLAGTDIPGLTS